jgi:gamma-glutamylcyclotransferase (GGCT)/AIG2-like uncharacterized protein YtfP
MLYFAYGMNTNSGQMSFRCPSARSLGYATLPRYQFRFDSHADVVPDNQSTVHGVLWEITDQCMKSLDVLEGYPHYYLRKTVTVHYRGQCLQAMTYYMTDNRNSYQPSSGYMNMLEQGYNEHGVPQDQIHSALELTKKWEKCII